MKKIFTLSFLVCLYFTPSQSQHLISSELLYSWTTAQLSTQGIFGAEYGVNMYKVVYNTLDPQGDSTVASGAIFIPQVNFCSFPMSIYCHGTIYLKEDVPSNNNGEALVGKYMGTFGYIGVLPDYLGLGEGPGLHPYMHAATEASATIDLMRATLEFCEANNIGFNDQVFITGYSQGGHAAVATYKEIEENLGDEFQVTACAGGSGPYDMSGVQAGTVGDDIPFESPEYLPYILFSYQSVYGNIYNGINDFFTPPYNETLPVLFDGLNSGATIAAAMPAIPNQIIVPAELDNYNNDPDHPLKLALRDNDLYDWAPQAPLRLYYCTGDMQVFHENALVAHAAMTDNGATDVTLMDMGTADHSGCVVPTLFDVLDWFDTMKIECAVGVNETAQQQILMFPNPANSSVQIQMSTYQIWNLKLVDMTGKIVAQQQVNGNLITLDTSTLTAGIYVVEIAEFPGKHARLVVKH